MQTCRECQQTKTDDCFEPTPTGKRRTLCRECRSAQVRAKRASVRLAREQAREGAQRFVQVEGNVVMIHLVTLYDVKTESMAREIAARMVSKGYKEIA